MTRLNKEEWLDHGLKALAQHGFTALKADTLAKSLGVSRGSFYWHFSNLAAYHEALLARWRDLTFETAVKEIESASGNIQDRLNVIINMAADSPLDVDMAMRMWAKANARVGQAVEEVDQLRLNYLVGIFSDLGLSPQIAVARARIVYYSFLGQLLIHEEITSEERSILISELINAVL
ncbi:MAG: TetR/AcrR family transcriptional regulator [Chloroflexota bacterium]